MDLLAFNMTSISEYHCLLPIVCDEVGVGLLALLYSLRPLLELRQLRALGDRLMVGALSNVRSTNIST